MIVITCVLFGKDFYDKENPKIISENIKTDDYKEFNLKPSNLTFAFWVEDVIGNLAHNISELMKTNII